MQFIRSDLAELSEDEVEKLRLEILESHGRLPNVVPKRSDWKYVTEDDFFSTAVGSLKSSSKLRFKLVISSKLLVLWTYRIFVVLTITALIGFVLASKAIFPDLAVLGAYLLGLAALGGMTLLLEYVRSHFYLVMFSFLSNGDILWFLRSDIQYDVHDVVLKEYAKLPYSQSRRVTISLSEQIVRKKVEQYVPEKLYKTELCLLYFLCFDYLLGRQQSIYSELETSRICLSLLSRLFLVNPASDLTCYYLGKYYLKVGELSEAAQNFERARLLNPSIAQYQILFSYCDYMAGIGLDSEK